MDKRTTHLCAIYIVHTRFLYSYSCGYILTWWYILLLVTTMTTEVIRMMLRCLRLAIDFRIFMQPRTCSKLKAAVHTKLAFGTLMIITAYHSSSMATSVGPPTASTPLSTHCSSSRITSYTSSTCSLKACIYLIIQVNVNIETKIILATFSKGT